MVTLISGLFLLLVPFILIDLFTDKKKGFIFVLFGVLSFHVALAFLSQLFGIFYYNVIISVSLLADLVAIITYFVIKTKKGFNFRLPEVDWIALILILITVATLYQVHYNYTGRINLTTDTTVVYHDVKNMQYVYPYFSDEWYAVSLIESSINNHSLPFKNILNNKFFFNLEFFTHSFLAEIMLILGLNPLTQYTLLSIFINTLIIVIAYVFLRLKSVSKLSSALASLSALYITCGANLPGMWHLIPITLGILFCMIGFCFLAQRDVKMMLFAFFVTSLFYPLLLPFYGLAAAIYLFFNFENVGPKAFKIIKYFLLSLLIALLTGFLILMFTPLSKFIGYMFSRLFYVSFSGSFITQMNIFYIIPLPVIFLAAIALSLIFKKEQWLFWQIVVGAVYWLFYSFTIYRAVIEFERVVYFTSLLIILAAGFGLKLLLEKAVSRYNKNGQKVFKIAEAAVLIIFIFLIPFYVRMSNWDKLVSVGPVGYGQIYPKSPANNYLTQDDLRVFKDIKNKKFLSIPWKGTVIGVATGNYPAVTKEGTISIGSVKKIELFFRANCQDKINIAKKMTIDYVYLPPFDCSSFEKIDQSNEGFVLYKFNNG